MIPLHIPGGLKAGSVGILDLLSGGSGGREGAHPAFAGYVFVTGHGIGQGHAIVHSERHRRHEFLSESGVEEVKDIGDFRITGG